MGLRFFLNFPGFPLVQNILIGRGTLHFGILCINFAAYSKVSGGDTSPLFHYSDLWLD